MTRIFTDGAEFQDILFWSSVSGAVASSAVQKRTGGFSYLIPNAATATKNIPNLSEFYLRSAYFRSTTATSIYWRAGSTTLGRFTVNLTSGFAELYVGAALVATGAIILDTSTWYMLEIHVNIADSGSIELKIDGISDASFTGDTKPDANTYADNLYFAGGALYVDDLALNDTTGGADNSWCGDGKVIIQTPNGAGDNTGLTPSAGNNYECVDDFPNDGDTTYVIDTVVDDYDLYNLTPCGLTDVDILRVFTEARARDVNAVGGLCSLGIKTESVEYWNASDLNLLTSYTSVVGSGYLLNPNTVSGWTTTQLDALQVGFKVR